MLPGAIVTPDSQTVNRLFARLRDQADQGLALNFQAILREVQSHWFEQQRGLLRCPICHSRHLMRNGWRPRVLASSRGWLRVSVLQAHCKNCRRTFRPLSKVLGLQSSRLLLDELMDKAVFLGTQVSFARSAALLKRLTSGSLSSEGIRRAIAHQASQVLLPKSRQGQTALVDATKAKAGAKERGEPVYLAITAEPGPLKSKRPSCRKKLVHLHVVDSKHLKRQLRAMHTTNIVHDGGEDLAVCDSNIQRCRWHLRYQFKHYLWQDGIPHAMRGSFQDKMSHILSDQCQGPQRYRKWRANLAQMGLNKTVNHLGNAAKEAFTYLKEPFAYIDTSPLEREMRKSTAGPISVPVGRQEDWKTS